jgi:phosphoadenosine phosphosulfate reductase
MLQTAQPVVLDPALAANVESTVLLLKQAVSDYERVVYSSSLGSEAMVLMDLIWTQVPEIDIVTVDTGRLPEETLGLLERLERRYGRRVQVFYPDAQAVERYVRDQGINGFYNGLSQRVSCCEIRKIEPFRRAVAGYAAWITGLRREQSAQRRIALPVERDDRFGLAKVSPLLDWTEEQIWTYIRANNVYYSPLHDRGYTSIGCAPCTRAVEAGQEHRAGRWWWEQSDSRECGLHPRQRFIASG